ncbi:hypothetical protein P5F75_17895 [Caldifermentibacillus hisashii]|uniref:hypothetical protein n=1 Tax=Caldifermentibacillus hisashii TaxID=996558 RepID=UPI002E208F12|nr:hypothetical protein [Caldifermentibacillus hisashii]
MKKILVIIGNHSPEPSSVANCTEPLINELSSRGYEIDIITDRKKVEVLNYESNGEINIYRFDNNFNVSFDLLNKLTKLKLGRLLTFLTRFFSLILKICYFIRYNIFTLEKQTSGWYVKDILKMCLELHKIKKYDSVISVSLPFKSHYIAKKLVSMVDDSSLKWFVYEYDPFGYNKLLSKSTIKKFLRLKREYKVFERCNYIFLTPELYHFYMKTPFSIFKDKFISMPFANIQKFTYEEEKIDIKLDSKNINCVFTGTLYQEIRNPKYAIEMFGNLDTNIQLIFLSNITQEAVNGANEVKSNVSFYPMQPRNKAKNILAKSDILVNIGNTVEFQIPGKIFEYISTGKPIVHFSKFPGDPSLKYLERYPLVLIIEEWKGNFEQQAKRLKSFCEKYKGVSIEYKEVINSLKGLDGDSVSRIFVDTITTLLEED